MMLSRHASTVSFRASGRRHLLALLLLAFVTAFPLQAAVRDESHWISTWTASPQPLWDGDFALPTQVPHHFLDQTLRQVARVSVGGKRVRVRLSNEYGTHPLSIGAAHLALAGEGAAIVAGTDRTLTFGGRPSVTIPAGAPVLSDPVTLDVEALGSVSVSLYLPAPTPPATFHWDARQTTYVGSGDQTAAATMQVESTLSARVVLSAILVDAAPDTRGIVALGDSITDGNGSTMDANRRWPDFLANRLARQNVAVLNAGISGARLLQDRMGVNALARFDRDVLAQPGVDTVIVLIGINDISWNGMLFAPDAAPAHADALIAGYRQLIARAHARNVRIVGATLTPFEGALQDTPMRGYYNAEKDRVRQAVNDWIRESGEFDAVIDFDAATRDPSRPTRLLPAYDSGDHLHPGDAGYRAMADAIDLPTLFDSPSHFLENR